MGKRGPKPDPNALRRQTPVEVLLPPPLREKVDRLVEAVGASSRASLIRDVLLEVTEPEPADQPTSDSPPRGKRGRKPDANALRRVGHNIGWRASPAVSAKLDRLASSRGIGRSEMLRALVEAVPEDSSPLDGGVLASATAHAAEMVHRARVERFLAEERREQRRFLAALEKRLESFLRGDDPQDVIGRSSVAGE